MLVSVVGGGPVLQIVSSLLVSGFQNVVVCFYFVLVGPGLQDIVVVVVLVVGCWLWLLLLLLLFFQNQTHMNTYIYTT